eukprot:m.104781 g.104781  ORF g.104781 m.104781 type:complete len:313 (-) comp9114_c0_seq1:715-1653(-)
MVVATRAELRAALLLQGSMTHQQVAAAGNGAVHQEDERPHKRRGSKHAHEEENKATEKARFVRHDQAPQSKGKRDDRDDEANGKVESDLEHKSHEELAKALLAARQSQEKEVEKRLALRKVLAALVALPEHLARRLHSVRAPEAYNGVGVAEKLHALGIDAIKATLGILQLSIALRNEFVVGRPEAPEPHIDLFIAIMCFLHGFGCLVPALDILSLTQLAEKLGLHLGRDLDRSRRIETEVEAKNPKADKCRHLGLAHKGAHTRNKRRVLAPARAGAGSSCDVHGKSLEGIGGSCGHQIVAVVAVVAGLIAA